MSHNNFAQVHRSVEELSEYSDFSQMAQYCKEIARSACCCDSYGV